MTEGVYIPSPDFHALFLLRHALNHFASISINLRNVLDWAFFIEKHTKEINWEWLQSVIDEYHMRDFYNCINAISVKDLGFNANIFPSVQYLPSLKDKVLNDILDPAYNGSNCAKISGKDKLVDKMIDNIEKLYVEMKSEK